MKKFFTLCFALLAVVGMNAKDVLTTENVWIGWSDATVVDGNTITFNEQWGGAGLELNMDLSEYEYIEVVFSELSCNVNLCGEYKEGDVTVASEVAGAMKGAKLVGIPLTGKLADYCDKITQIFLQRTGADAGKAVIEGVYLCSKEEFEADKAAAQTGGSSQIIWQGSWSCENWAGNQELAWNAFDWASVSVGTILRIHVAYNANADGYAQMSLRHGADWGNLPGNAGSSIAISETTEYVEQTLTKEILDDLVANGGLVITGTHYTMTKVELVAPVEEKVIWSGEFSSGAWENALDALAWSGYDWSTVSAGAKLTFYYTYVENANTWGCIALAHGQDWGALPGDAYKQIDFGASTGVQTVSAVLSKEILSDLVANGGLIVRGANYILSKITLADGGTTGIETVGADKVAVSDGKIYNLQGIMVDDSYKGIVIKNGKKFLNK